MKETLKPLWLITLLLFLSSLLLLASDIGQRRPATQDTKKPYPDIAIFQITSTFLIDAHVKGIVDRLEEKGMLAPDRKNLKIYNPQGDMPTANAIARDIASSSFDVVITSSTLALQTFASANAATRKPHIFGAVTNPYTTGVGITGPEPDQHPPYLAGIGTFQPVREAITIAREMHPGLRRIGVVWNPAEQSSESCLIEARKTVKDLDIQLMEAIAANTSEVYEVTQSLISKGAEALWIGGDVVATASIGLMVKLATQAGIPVFTNDPLDAAKGALFGLGADYGTVGSLTADMAIAVLEGESPASFRIENVVPQLLDINQEVLSLYPKWRMTERLQKILQKQEKVPEQKAVRRKEPFRIRMVLYSETEFAERSREGYLEGLRKAGLEPGRDYEMRIFNAQGDMATLSSIMLSIQADQPDLVMVVSTPTLQAALRQVADTSPVVFTGVGDAVRAGAGKSETDHHPHVTGITTRSPFRGMAALIKETLPGARRVGTLFTPAEINSELYRSWFAEALGDEGIELVSLPVTSPSDIPQAAEEMIRQNIGAVAQIVDNFTRPGFALIARRADEKNLPVYVFDSAQMKEGGTLALARDYHDAALEASEMAVRILNGEKPAAIPFRNASMEALILNPDLAERYGLSISEAIRKRAALYPSAAQRPLSPGIGDTGCMVSVTPQNPTRF